MPGLKETWIKFVKQQTEKTAHDPNARVKMIGWVAILLIIAYSVPKADASVLACGPCMVWAVPFCAQAVAAGGVCAAVALFPPALCACLLASGGFMCAASAGTCAVVCLLPTP